MKKLNIPLRLRLFIPVGGFVTIIILILTVYFVNKSIEEFNTQLENNLHLEVKTILNMLEREYALKSDQVKSDLKVASSFFKSSDFNITGDSVKTEITNQISKTKHFCYLKNWKINGEDLFTDNKFVDSLQTMFGGTVTVFQKADSGFVRISTNVMDENNQRALRTYIPEDSEVSRQLLSGKTYYGRAFVVDEWYITAYEPIINNDMVIGALYVGSKEKDLKNLKTFLYKLKIGKSGYPLVFDRNGLLLIHPEREGQNWGDSTLFKQIKESEQGIIKYSFNGQRKIMAFEYFKQYELYVGATVLYDTETEEFRNDLINGAVIIGFAALLLILAFIYIFNSERISRSFNELQKSRKEIDTISVALEESEERFRKLFDSTGDDIFVTDINENIVEVNTAACESLDYTREELLKMKISDIKSDKYKSQITENRKNIFEKGIYFFESEHIKKSGELFQVEFTSRVFKINGEDFILSVVRDISSRVEFERQILSAVIKGEERERQRFAREMHDGLGPLLSALKLYVNELKSISMPEEERKMLIAQSNELIDEAVNTTRTISNNLMPTILQSYGLNKAVQTFCDKVNKTNQLVINFNTRNIADKFDNNLELILFRVISELINNTIKHAKAKSVNIFLEKEHNVLSLSYSDDGIGFAAEKIIMSDIGGTGLKNIISRIKSINGKYYFGKNPDDGFNIKIEIII